MISDILLQIHASPIMYSHFDCVIELARTNLITYGWPKGKRRSKFKNALPSRISKTNKNSLVSINYNSIHYLMRHTDHNF